MDHLPFSNSNNPAVFIKNDWFPNGQSFQARIPSYIDRSVPAATATHNTAPGSEAAAARRASTLQLLEPRILYVKFACPQNCRNYGICVHYQFLLGCKRCPDGLICDRCQAAAAAADAAAANNAANTKTEPDEVDVGGVAIPRLKLGRGGNNDGNANSSNQIERAVPAARNCPLHQHSANGRRLSSRPEDFLASPAQREYAMRAMRMAMALAMGDGGSAGASVGARMAAPAVAEDTPPEWQQLTREWQQLTPEWQQFTREEQQGQTPGWSHGYGNDPPTNMMDIGTMLPDSTYNPAMFQSAFIPAEGQDPMMSNDVSESAPAMSAPGFPTGSMLPPVRELLMPPPPLMPQGQSLQRLQQQQQQQPSSSYFVQQPQPLSFQQQPQSLSFQQQPWVLPEQDPIFPAQYPIFPQQAQQPLPQLQQPLQQLQQPLQQPQSQHLQQPLSQPQHPQHPQHPQQPQPDPGERSATSSRQLRDLYTLWEQ